MIQDQSNIFFRSQTCRSSKCWREIAEGEQVGPELCAHPAHWRPERVMIRTQHQLICFGGSWKGPISCHCGDDVFKTCWFPKSKQSALPNGQQHVCRDCLAWITAEAKTIILHKFLPKKRAVHVRNFKWHLMYLFFHWHFPLINVLVGIDFDRVLAQCDVGHAPRLDGLPQYIRALLTAVEKCRHLHMATLGVLQLLNYFSGYDLQTDHPIPRCSAFVSANIKTALNFL